MRTASTLLIAALAAGPALATSYSAKPAAPVGAKVVAKQLVWSCGAGACRGTTGDSRPVIVCQSLARKVGRLDSFAADGRAFTAAELERCNASARDRGHAAVASAAN